MTHVLLIIIYVAFISLGLPDGILGAAWPSMYSELAVPVSFAGILSMIISAGTIVSSLNTARLVRRFGTGAMTAGSVTLTAIGLLGFSFSPSFIWLCIFALPYGLGAGGVDAALNNYVALHYQSRHMSWLHSFWGVGAALGPYIVSLVLTNNMRWNRAYQIIGLIQVTLVMVLLLSQPLWDRARRAREPVRIESRSLSLGEIVRIEGALKLMLTFFAYCAIETTTGLWASSYLVLSRGLHAEQAASWAGLFYLGITGGRLLSGFIADKLGDRNMVRGGIAVAALGVLMLFPQALWTGMAALLLIGLGCAPIFPSLLHATPVNFGAENSQALMGVQMASAYLGTMLMAPFFGMLVNFFSISLLPFYLIVFVVLMALMTESFNASRRAAN